MTKTLQRSQRREEGAAMLVTMLVLMMVTATGVFAVHSTSYEIRASGHSRQLMRTQYIAENGLGATLAWVDQYQASGLHRVLERSTDIQLGATALDLAPFEPPMVGGKRAHRFYQEDFDNLNVPGIPAGEWQADNVDLGVDSLYTPFVLVDVYDDHEPMFTPPGSDASPDGTLRYLGSVVTSRGRTRIGDGNDWVELDVTNRLDPDLASSEGSQIQFRGQETASDARMYGVFGPYGS